MTQPHHRGPGPDQDTAGPDTHPDQHTGDHRPRRSGGLRLRIAVTIAGIVFVAVGGLGVAVHLLVVQNRIADTRAAADERIHAALDIYASTGLISFDAEVDDPAVPAPLRRSLTGDGARGTYLTGVGTRDLWAAGMSDGRVLSIHTRFSPVDESVQAVDQALLIAGVITVLVASGLGALSANRLSRRLRLAARTAGSVSAGTENRSLRSAVGSGRDEVGDLADAVDAMAERLAQRLRSEQRFTADVAHDLRTPLAGLVAASALLDDSRPAQLVRERAAALTTLVEELLEVARLDSGVETAELEHVSIPEVVQRAVGRGVAKGEFPDGAVIIQAAGEPLTTLTDPRRLERVLSNLIRNALRHGRPPVQVIVDGREISVLDQGDGFGEDFLRTGPQRFAQPETHRSAGHGLGLVIATGQARVLGGEMTFANRPTGGAQVTLALPAVTLRRSPSPTAET